MNRGLITIIELYSKNVDDLPVKAIKALAASTAYMHEEGMCAELLALVNKSTKVHYYSRSELKLLLKENLWKPNLCITTSRLDETYDALINAGAIDIEVIPALKPYLLITGENKLSITKRGVNTSLVVVKERTDISKILAHLEFTIKTNASLVIQNNFHYLEEIIKFLSLKKKKTLPIAIITNVKGQMNWAFESIETIQESSILKTANSDKILVIGESIREFNPAKRREAVYSL